MKFSVLIPVYFRDNPINFNLALKSIWDDQTLKPSEIIIVKDGPLTKELDAVVSSFTERAPVVTVTLKQNQGLGKALAIGLECCSNSYVARMDSDDISLPNRFEEQIKYLEKFPRTDILGTAINEFTSDPKEIYARRTLPANNYQIYRFASFRCPFNHMTVMFRKSFILSIGSYESFDKYEDYWLWIRAILSGAVCANLNQPLVNVRAGNDMICRRKGWKIFYGEITLLERMKTIKFITKYEFIKLFFLRACPRLLPSHLLKIIYRWLHK